VVTTSALDVRRYLRHPGWDLLALGLTVMHVSVLVLASSVPVIAIGMWWNANTIAHHFIHNPFFRSRAANRIYSALLTLVLGVPQTLWRRRHLDHHFPHRLDRPSSDARVLGAQFAVELILLLTMWLAMGVAAPRFLLFTYWPGWGLGLVLCHVHGYYEHARGTTSHYGRLYNFLFFNDGFHVEHHARPSTHWAHLRGRGARSIGSAWPPVLRWLDAFSLNGLERAALEWPSLQRVMLRTHRRAFSRLLPSLGNVTSITVVGGGLFPRTPLVLRELMPRARLSVCDANPAHVALARRFLESDVDWRVGTFAATEWHDADLIVVPLAYVGDRSALYDRPPAATVVVHDWLWRSRGESVVVAWWLLKRMNLVKGEASAVLPRRPAA
jgi:hypothetical protein